MALRFVSALLCTIFAISSALALPPPPPTGDCGLNAERRSCGSACAPTCSDPNPGPICVLPCVDACFCKEGYLKAANGVCVRPDECDSVPHLPNMQIPQFNIPQEPPKCGDDEEYRTCGSACVPTCAMPLPRPWCTRRCSVGCYCKEGYLRDEQNVCIPATKCKSMVAFAQAANPINIPLHKFPSKSGSTPFIPLGPGPVIFPTHKPILQLGPGPVILPKSASAPIDIPLQKVPISPLCPKGEHYNTCGVQLDCLASCKIPMTPKCMERMCTPGCVCPEPLLRHEDGRCVEKTECPKKLIKSN